MNIEEIVKTLNMRADHHCNEYRRAKILPREGEDSIYLDGFSDGYNSAVADLQDELKKLKNLGNKGLPVIIQKPSQLPTTKPNKEDSDSSK